MRCICTVSMVSNDSVTAQGRGIEFNPSSIRAVIDHSVSYPHELK